VSNLNGNNISVIDIATNAVTGYLCSCCQNVNTPYFLSFIDNTSAYIGSWGSNQVLIATPSAGMLTGAVSVGSFPFSFPSNIAVTPDNSTALIINGQSQISICDVSTNTITGYVSGSFNGGFDIAITSDSSTAYVTNLNNGDISIVDISSGSVTGTVDTTSFPLESAYFISIQP